MSAINSNEFILLRQEEDKRLIFDQYKLLVESLNKINEIRETANTFWTGLNGTLIAGIAYVRDADGLGGLQKSYFVWTVIALGIILSLSWLSYLSSIKKSVDIRNGMLIQLEKYLPAKIFTISIAQMGRQQGKGSLSIKEMFVPVVFLLGYIFFSIAFYFYPRIIN